MSGGDDEDGDHDGVADGTDASTRNRPAFALLLIAAIAGWNAWQAFRAPTTRAAMPPTLLVAGVVALGIGIAGPRAFRMVAYLAGAALCLAALAAGA